MPFGGDAFVGFFPLVQNTSNWNTSKHQVLRILGLISKRTNIRLAFNILLISRLWRLRTGALTLDASSGLNGCACSVLLADVSGS